MTLRPRTTSRSLAIAVGTAIAALFACGSAAAAVSLPPAFHLHTFASGGSSLSAPDDITKLGDTIYLVYQNNSNADGTPPGSMSTVVGYGFDGTERGSWNVTGHADGLTADPGRDELIVTVNEDANSSVYTIDPDAPWWRQLRHYSYSPDPASLTGGGTDAVSVLHGRIFVSASNPSPDTPGGSTFSAPAVFEMTIPRFGDTAYLTPTFYDNSPAIDALSWQPVTLNLSDPDSNAVVPWTSPRFGGDFVLDSQGDSELIFARDPGTPWQRLARLTLSSSGGGPQVDDVRWTTSRVGTLFLVDASQNQIDAITGPFGPGTVLTAIPSDSAALAGDLGVVDLWSGAVTPLGTGFGSPKGLLYVPRQHADGPPFGSGRPWKISSGGRRH